MAPYRGAFGARFFLFLRRRKTDRREERPAESVFYGRSYRARRAIGKLNHSAAMLLREAECSLFLCAGYRKSVHSPVYCKRFAGSEALKHQVFMSETPGAVKRQPIKNGARTVRETGFRCNNIRQANAPGRDKHEKHPLDKRGIHY